MTQGNQPETEIGTHRIDTPLRKQEIPSGTQIGNYRIDSLLGQGGMAQVYRARPAGLGRYEALKVLSPDLAHDQEFVKRFLQEAHTASRLKHDNIVTIHAVSDTNADRPYFTMELIEGSNLAERLRQQRFLTPEEALPLLEQIALALDYAHQQGVIHRDIKPANILLEQHGHNPLRVKLVDFGIAHAYQESSDTRLTRSGMTIGTPEYMSPEQANDTTIDARSDLYSLGIVAYEMLCGEPPFRASTPTAVLVRHLNEQPRRPSSLGPSLTRDVDAPLLKALEKKPGDRFASCTAFVNALRDTLNIGTTVPIKRDRQKDDAWKPALVASIIVLIGGSLFVGSAWQKHQTISQAESQAKQAEEIIDDVAIQTEKLVLRSRISGIPMNETKRIKDELKQKLGDALSLAETAISHDATNQKAWLDRARVYYYLPDRARAISTLDTAMQRFPKSSQFRLLRSKLDAHK